MANYSDVCFFQRFMWDTLATDGLIARTSEKRPLTRNFPLVCEKAL